MKKEKEHFIEVDFTDEELAELENKAATLQINIDDYAVSMVTKGYALAGSIYAEELHLISPNATSDQIINAQLDSTLNQMVLSMEVFERLADDLNHFTILEMLEKRLGKDISGCTTLSEWIFKEAIKRGSKLN
ncbi:MAG: hypothetical protein AAF849_06185 [Bacteroidota bacterium]